MSIVRSGWEGFVLKIDKSIGKKDKKRVDHPLMLCIFPFNQTVCLDVLRPAILVPKMAAKKTNDVQPNPCPCHRFTGRLGNPSPR